MLQETLDGARLDSIGRAPSTRRCTKNRSSFEELYEISPTFRMLADDQGVAVLDSPQRPVETSPEPVSDAGDSIHYVEPESIA